MTNEERLAAAKKLISDARRHGVKPNCKACVYSRDADCSSLSRCVSPIAFLESVNDAGQPNWPNLLEMRANRGLCGPDGLHFTRPKFIRPFWRQPTMDLQVVTAPIQVIAALVVLIFVARLCVVLAR